MIDKSLFHYGVKGMHWGVRRFQPYKSTNSKNDRRFSYDDDIVVPKGTEAYRITTKKFDSEKKTGTYLTVDENDRNFYKGTWGNELKSLGNNEKIYENTYKIKKDLISPSANKRQTIAANLARDPNIQHEIAKGLFYNRLVENGLDSGKAHVYQDYWESVKDPEYMKTLSNYESGMLKSRDITKDDEAAGLFLGALGANDNLKVIYGKKIVESGYNMVIDDHGADYAGEYQKVNAPIIVYDTNNLLDKVGSKPVSDLDAKKALSTYSKDIAEIPGSFAEKNYVPNVLKRRYGLDNYYNNKSYDYLY